MKNEDAFGGVQCNAVRPQTEPDLMGWDSGSRANLNRLRREGAVVVRYAAKGCNVELEVLSHCVVTKAQYKYSPYAAKETKVAHDANELFAQLPLGAASLSGRLKGNRALRTDYILVGTSSLPASSVIARDELHGNGCERATHVVSSVYLGGFAIAAGEQQHLSAEASIFSAGAGASSDRSAERVAFEGAPDACEKALGEGAELPLCSVPLRIALLPLAPSASQEAPAVKGAGPTTTTPAPTASTTTSTSTAAGPPKTATPPEPSKAAEPAKRPVFKSFLSEQSQMMVDSMESNNVPVIRAADGSSQTIVLPSDVLFRAGTGELSDGGRKIVTTGLAQTIKASPDVDVEIIGHTDEGNDAATSLKISLARAKEVSSGLIAGGVSSSIVKSGGRGATEPFSGSTANPKVWNRRVEVVLRPRVRTAPVAAGTPPPSTGGGGCARWSGDYSAAMRGRDNECVRTMLLPRLNSGAISAPEARYLKAACGALGDRACEKRAAEKL